MGKFKEFLASDSELVMRPVREFLGLDSESGWVTLEDKEGNPYRVNIAEKIEAANEKKAEKQVKDMSPEERFIYEFEKGSPEKQQSQIEQWKQDIAKAKKEIKADQKKQKELPIEDFKLSEIEDFYKAFEKAHNEYSFAGNEIHKFYDLWKRQFNLPEKEVKAIQNKKDDVNFWKQRLNEIKQRRDEIYRENYTARDNIRANENTIKTYERSLKIITDHRKNKKKS